MTFWLPLSLVSTASSSFFPSLRLSGCIASPNVTLSTPIAPFSLAPCERANNSSEQPINSAVTTCPHPSPRTAAGQSARHVSDRLLPNVVPPTKSDKFWRSAWHYKVSFKLRTRRTRLNHSTHRGRKDRGAVEGEGEEVVSLTWLGRSVSPMSKKLALVTHPLCLLQQARLENNDVIRQLEAKRSTAAGPIESRQTPTVLRHVRISAPLAD